MQYHYYLYGMRVTADLDFVQLDPVRLPEDDRDFGREKVRIRAMDEEEEAQFRKEHGDCVCGSFLGTEKGWLCNRTLAMSVELGTGDPVSHPEGRRSQERYEPICWALE